MKTHEKTIVIASGNAGKIREIREALSPLGARLPSLSDLGIAQTAEPHPTFMENALAKARAASAAASLPAIADDSGIAVAALNGAPGVLSARYADGGDNANNQKLLAAMQNAEDRRAFYYAAMVFVRSPDDPAPAVCRGAVARRDFARVARRRRLRLRPSFLRPANEKNRRANVARRKKQSQPSRLIPPPPNPPFAFAELNSGGGKSFNKAGGGLIAADAGAGYPAAVGREK